jgi:hypothetical protein
VERGLDLVPNSAWGPYCSNRHGISGGSGRCDDLRSTHSDELIGFYRLLSVGLHLRLLTGWPSRGHIHLRAGAEKDELICGYLYRTQSGF